MGNMALWSCTYFDNMGSDGLLVKGRRKTEQNYRISYKYAGTHFIWRNAALFMGNADCGVSGSPGFAACAVYDRNSIRQCNGDAVG